MQVTLPGVYNSQRVRYIKDRNNEGNRDMNTYQELLAKAMDSPLERICRAAEAHDEAVLASPGAYTRKEVQAAKLSSYQRSMLVPAAIFRYDD
jgi:hypothetical protein